MPRLELDRPPTILERLEAARVLKVEKDGPNLMFREACDDWFNHILTKEEVLELVEELKALVA
jgi:hypothetical protein